MVNTPPLFQTAPVGNPTADVGIFIIDKLLTNVVQSLSAVILDPTIMEWKQLDILLHPPRIDEYVPDDMLDCPPLIIDQSPEAVLPPPPPIVAP